MQFKIRYYRNPLAKANSQQKHKGQKLFNRGTYNLEKFLRNDHSHINPAVNTRKAIHGLAYQFGFKYRKLLQDNFMNQSQKATQWFSTINNLKTTLQKIHLYPNLSSLLQSKYVKDIQIAKIQKYYHPRKEHLANNARIILAKIGENHRCCFTGAYKRFGRKKNGQLTILLTDIQYHHHLVTNHLWFNATKGFKRLGKLQVNDLIEFKARIHKYSKGYLPKNFVPRYDYGLCYPTKIRKLK